MVSSRPESANPVKEHVPLHTPPTFLPTYTIRSAQAKNERTDSVILDPQEFLAIKKDLLMTLVLAGCIIMGEIVLWKAAR